MKQSAETDTATSAASAASVNLIQKKKQQHALDIIRVFFTHDDLPTMRLNDSDADVIIKAVCDRDGGATQTAEYLCEYVIPIVDALDAMSGGAITFALCRLVMACSCRLPGAETDDPEIVVTPASVQFTFGCTSHDLLTTLLYKTVISWWKEGLADYVSKLFAAFPRYATAWVGSKVDRIFADRPEYKSGHTRYWDDASITRLIHEPSAIMSSETRSSSFYFPFEEAKVDLHPKHDAPSLSCRFGQESRWQESFTKRFETNLWKARDELVAVLLGQCDTRFAPRRELMPVLSPKVVLAGGSVKKFMFDIPMFWGSDLDLWFVGHSTLEDCQESLIRTISAIVWNSRLYGDGDEGVVNPGMLWKLELLGHVLTLTSNAVGRNPQRASWQTCNFQVQFVLRSFKTPTQLITCFDHAPVQCTFDGSRVMATDGCLLSGLNGICVADPTIATKSVRALKQQGDGFSVAVPLESGGKIDEMRAKISITSSERLKEIILKGRGSVQAITALATLLSRDPKANHAVRESMAAAEASSQRALFYDYYHKSPRLPKVCNPVAVSESGEINTRMMTTFFLNGTSCSEFPLNIEIVEWMRKLKEQECWYEDEHCVIQPLQPHASASASAKINNQKNVNLMLFGRKRCTSGLLAAADVESVTWHKDFSVLESMVRSVVTTSIVRDSWILENPTERFGTPGVHLELAPSDV